MNNPIHFTDENYRRQQPGNDDLLIHISAHSISYAIVNENQIKVLFEADFSEHEKTPLAKRFEQFWQSQPQLQTEFKSTKVSVVTGKFTFIPTQLYTESELDGYAKFVQPNRATDVLVNNISPAELKNIVVIDTLLQQELQKRFKNLSIFSQVEPFIEGIYQTNNKSSNHLFLNFYTGGFEAAFLQNGHLRFYNTFQVENADEFNYFLLNLIQQFGPDTKETKITLTGMIGQNDEIYKRIQKYFADISFGKSNQPINNLPTNISAHTYFSLLSLHLCE
ncbi:MAG TPA: DUF3822 family protein [Daejeonella sp.]|nr:DUF3822 family protein [Daejeonella sp.]